MCELEHNSKFWSVLIRKVNAEYELLRKEHPEAAKEELKIMLIRKYTK